MLLESRSLLKPDEVREFKQACLVLIYPGWSPDLTRARVVAISPEAGREVDIPGATGLGEDGSHQELLTQQELVVQRQGGLVGRVQPPDRPVDGSSGLLGLPG